MATLVKCMDDKLSSLPARGKMKAQNSDLAACQGYWAESSKAEANSASEAFELSAMEAYRKHEQAAVPKHSVLLSMSHKHLVCLCSDGPSNLKDGFCLCGRELAVKTGREGTHSNPAVTRWECEDGLLRLDVVLNGQVYIGALSNVQLPGVPRYAIARTVISVSVSKLDCRCAQGLQLHPASA